MKRIIEKTDDGSTTLFVPELNEHYHSTKGARTESQHIFINMGLKASTATTPHILEIGFGTGLNAWLTLEEAEKSGRNVYYTGLELYPLEWQLVEQLGYISANEQLMPGDNQCPAHELFKQLHTSPWEEDVPITPHFTLRKVQKDFNKLETETEGWKADESSGECCRPQDSSWNVFPALREENGKYCGPGNKNKNLKTKTRISKTR